MLGTNVYAENLKFTKIVSLDKPWGSSFVSDNEMIITEKSGKIKIVNIKNGNADSVEHNLNFLETGQGGLLDIFYKDNNLWISYAENRGNSETSTSIARGKFNKEKINFKKIIHELNVDLANSDSLENTLLTSILNLKPWLG